MLATVLISAAIGILIAATAFIMGMRLFMIRPYRLHASFEDVCANIEKAIKSVDGWAHPVPDWDFHSAVSRSYTFKNIKKKRVFFICKAEYANRIVDRYPHMGAMMPCTWAIYETTDGKVYVAKMNIAMMSKMFFGNVIGSTMAKVAREEHKMMAELRRLVE